MPKRSREDDEEAVPARKKKQLCSKPLQSAGKAGMSFAEANTLCGFEYGEDHIAFWSASDTLCCKEKKMTPFQLAFARLRFNLPQYDDRLLVIKRAIRNPGYLEMALQMQRNDLQDPRMLEQFQDFGQQVQQLQDKLWRARSPGRKRIIVRQIAIATKAFVYYLALASTKTVKGVITFHTSSYMGKSAWIMATCIHTTSLISSGWSPPLAIAFGLAKGAAWPYTAAMGIMNFSSFVMQLRETILSEIQAITGQISEITALAMDNATAMAALGTEMAAQKARSLAAEQAGRAMSDQLVQLMSNQSMFEQDLQMLQGELYQQGATAASGSMDVLLQAGTKIATQAVTSIGWSTVQNLLLSQTGLPMLIN